MKYNDNGIWKDLTVKVSDTLPIGTVIPFAGNTVPSDWMVCDGSAISRTVYSTLFGVIGTAFGEGDGETTFNIPDLQGKVAVGVDLEDTDFDTIGETGGEKEHTLTVDEIPAHSHEISANKIAYTIQENPVGIINLNHAGNATGETENTGGSQSHNNIQPYQVVNYIIKATKTVTGEYISETLPIGTELDFNGETTDIPDGWEQISDGIKLLWTNTSPASAFASQTITLSSGDYDFYEIYFTYNEGTAIQYANGFKTVKGKGMLVSENGYTTGLSVRRKVDYVDATHLLISSAYAGSDANQNGYLIPIYVVGYKTGIFN